ncbi:DNA polymerase beta superfamily protein [Paenibacillus herberti]|uniref:DNA polymerase beta superfamily protein n=1 Tax=Paenibacillus herberti TaxID=1619309 RepID=UPI00159632FD|nr:nucleotidyltransferase domain-containing protein [Paenibacillus herberti]
MLRSTLACQWLEERGSIPPVEFQQLTEALLPDGSELKHVVDELLFRKRSGEELDNEPPIPILQDYLAERLAYYTQLASELPAVAGPNSVQLDDWFLSALRESWSFSVN